MILMIVWDVCNKVVIHWKRFTQGMRKYIWVKIRGDYFSLKYGMSNDCLRPSSPLEMCFSTNEWEQNQVC